MNSTLNQPILVIGTGYVGLVTGTCLAELGKKVICLDNNSAKIDALTKGTLPFYEPDLEQLLQKNTASGNLSFRHRLDQIVDSVSLILITVGTPTEPQTGHANLSAIKTVISEIAGLIKSAKTIVIKSTVPPGTTRQLQKMMNQLNPEICCDFVCNPEFLREGAAVYDFMNADRIICGAQTENAIDQMHTLYQALIQKNVPIIHTNLESAESIKYASNCFLATKIAFINEMSNLCEKVGADIDQVVAGMGIDPRIGSSYLKVGPGFGGSCFPKDTQALNQYAQDLKVPLTIINAVVHANAQRKKDMVHKIIQICQGRVKTKKMTILGLAFKANTDDIRDSPALDIILGLIEAGADLKVYDPAAMQNARSLLGTTVLFTESIEQALVSVEIIVIATEWPLFKDIDFSNLQSPKPMIIDLRNLYDPVIMQKKEINYISLGRPSGH